MLDSVGRIVLIDFGLARSFGDEISGGVTRAVTPGYAPPEQYAGSARIGPPADVYGLASTAYKLLTGVTPTNVFDRQAGAELPAPHVLRPEVPGLVSNAVLDGMELNADHRPANVAALLDRLGLHGQRLGPRALIAGSRFDRDDATRADPVGAARDATAHAGPPAPAGDLAAPRVPGPPLPAGVMVAGSAGPLGTVAPPVIARPGDLRVDGPPPQVLDLRGGRAPFAPWHDGSPPVVGPGAFVERMGDRSARRRGGCPRIGGAAHRVGDRDRVAPSRCRHGRRRRGAPPSPGDRRGTPRLASGGDVHGRPTARSAQPRRLVGASSAGHRHRRHRGGGRARHRGSAIRGVWRDWAIRLCGVAMALVLLVPARHGGRTFRSDPGITRWATWAMEGRERPGSRTATIWVVAVFGLALGAWLHPELWPLS